MIRRGKEAELDLAGVGGGMIDGSLAVPAAPEPPAPRVRTLAERLVDGARDGIVACDERGVVRSVNAAARRLLPGLREGELLDAAALAPLVAAGDAAEVVEFELAGHAIDAHRRALPDGWTAWYLRDVGEQRSRLDNLLAERARSRFLAAASRRLGLSLHPGRTARAVVELAVTELADAVLVVLPARGGAVEWFGCARGCAVATGSAPRAGMPGPVVDALDGVRAGPRPQLEEHLAGMPWAPGVDVAAAATLELPGNGVPAGALVLMRREAAARPDELQETLVEEFAQRAGIALAAATLYAAQARTAAVLRRSLVQPQLPQRPGMTFGAAYRPAEESLHIGGDLYDVHEGPGGGTLFLLGDVCGKGIDAAVGTGRLRQSVRALRRVAGDPVRLLTMLNTTMLESTPEDEPPAFATLVLGTAVPTAAGGLRLRLAGGGHLPPLLVRRSGAVEPVELGGMLVGAVPGARFRARSVELAPGEACVLYTDGVTEARGGLDGATALGEQRLARLLAGCHVMPAPGIAERVELHTDRWLAAGHHDDIAVLVVQAPLRAVARPFVTPGRRHLHAVHPDEEVP